MLQNGGRSLLCIDFLQDPFPTNFALSGAVVQTTQTGEFKIYNLDAIQKTPTEDSDSNTNNSNSAVMEVVRLQQRPGGSSTLPSGIFHIAQRPGTNQLAVTTLSTQAHILRLEQQKSEKNVNIAEAYGEVDMVDIEDSGDGRSAESLDQNGKRIDNTWGLDIEYNLEGHTGGCASVRISNDRAVTACFDGGIRVFELPPVETTRRTTPTTSTPTSNSGFHLNSNSISITNTNGVYYQPKALHPVCTFMDDPEHTLNPPLSEHNRGVCGLALSSTAHRIVSGSNDMQIKVWDTTTGRITLRLGGCMGWPWWVEGLDTELNAVASASTDGFVREWDLRAGHENFAINLNSDPTSSIFPVATVIPRVDGNYLVAGCFDKSIYVVDRRMALVLKELKGHTDRLARLALRGDTLLSCAFDGDLGLWEFE